MNFTAVRSECGSNFYLCLRYILTSNINKMSFVFWLEQKRCKFLIIMDRSNKIWTTRYFIKIKKKTLSVHFHLHFLNDVKVDVLHRMFLDTVQCTGVREIWTISNLFWVDTDLRKLYMVFEKGEHEQLILHKAHVIFVKRSITDLQIHI